MSFPEVKHEALLSEVRTETDKTKGISSQEFIQADFQNSPYESSQFWQSRSERELNEEDCRQIQENVVGFFSVLQEWQKKEGQVDVRYEKN